MTPKTQKSENLTGIASHEEKAKDMLIASAQFPPTSTGSKVMDEKVRIDYAREIGEDNLGYGSVPEPVGLAGKARAAIAGLLGKRPMLLFNKLGERLAFERMGVRVYEMLVSKHEAFGGFDGGPSRQDLMEILNEEHRHFSMLTEVVVRLGGDPTAVTPAANAVALVASGVQKVIADPRTSLVSSLDAVLVAELADREGWNGLLTVARTADRDELVKLFTEAKLREEQHIAKVRRWLAAGLALQTAAPGGC